MNTKLIEVDRSKGRSLAVLIFDVYQEYLRNMYPHDPAVYVVRAHPNTLQKITSYFEGIQYEPPIAWGMQLVADIRLEEGTVVFGPETVEFKWK